MASIPLARQLSNIRKTISNGKLIQGRQPLEKGKEKRRLPVAEHSQEPLRTIHAGLDTLTDEMKMENWEDFLNQAVELHVLVSVSTRCYSIMHVPGTGGNIQRELGSSRDQ